MMTEATMPGVVRQEPVRPGEAAPGFTLPAINKDGEVRLDDYHGRQPVLVAFFRGLHCPFCRRHMVEVGEIADRLEPLGVGAVGIVGTQQERARVYFRYRPTSALLAADPETTTHKAFGLPKPEFSENETDWPRTISMSDVMSTPLDSRGEFSERMPLQKLAKAMDEKDGFEATEVDTRIAETQGAILTGYFLIDSEGIVRWHFIEAADAFTNFGLGPRADDILRAASGLVN